MTIPWTLRTRYVEPEHVGGTLHIADRDMEYDLHNIEIVALHTTNTNMWARR
jgi:hypothetical protein